MVELNLAEAKKIVGGTTSGTSSVITLNKTFGNGDVTQESLIDSPVVVQNITPGPYSYPRRGF